MSSVNSSDLVFGGAIGTVYSSPFNDVSKKWLPKTQEDLIHWCQYYLENNPLIQQAVRRMSSYPITDILPVVDDIKKQEDALKVISDLNLRELCKTIAMQYFGFGDSYVTVFPKFTRYYKCEKCTKEFTPKLLQTYLDEYNLKSRRKKPKYMVKGSKSKHLVLPLCPFCKAENIKIKIIDKSAKTISDDNIVLLHPKNIRVNSNPISGKKELRYVIDGTTKRKVLRGDLFYIETSPRLFIEAALKNKDIILDNKNVYHFSRTPVDPAAGKGHPIIQGVLRELFQSQVVKKATEAISLQHINPLTIVYPENVSGANIYQHLDLNKWSTEVEKQLRQWRRDPNHIPIMPVPVGVNYIGGQHKGIEPTALLDHFNEEIAMGMGVPKEFLIGGTSFSGSSISLRMLENDFINLRTLLAEFLNSFLLPTVYKSGNKNAKFTINFSKLRTADEIQQKELMVRLAESGKISDGTLLSELGFDSDKEQEALEKEFKTKMDREQKINQHSFGSSGRLYDISVPTKDLQSTELSPEMLMDFMAQMVQDAPEDGQRYYEDMMRNTSPVLHSTIQSKIQKSNKKPLPDQKPPRRTNSPV